jgi:4'-phosphopantetheinyl transferase
MPPPLERPLAWQPGPRSPNLRDGEIHVWRADLDGPDDGSLAWLSVDEHARADRILDARRRRRSARSRALLRSLLSAYLDVSPAALRLAQGPSGKPRLASPAVACERVPELSFNLSHSEHLWLLALARRPVGVDIELDRRPLDEPALAARAFSPDQARRLAKLEPPARREQFLRLWARREAVLKWRGIRISDARASPNATEPSPGPAPWLIDLPVGDGAAGALATGAEPRAVRCWQWQPPRAEAGDC